jgi:DNA mismatch repair protein MutS2
MLLGIAEVEIIHGKGDGILRSVVREVLAEYQEIKDYRDQHADSGGHGVTVVRLK